MKNYYASFSEAIYQGAKLRAQAFGAPETMKRNWDSCVLEAGVQAIRGHFREANTVAFYRFIETAYPYMKNQSECPVCGTADQYVASLTALCWHLNDHHRWTREAIGEWLLEREEKLGYVTVSDERFGSTQPPACASPLPDAVESRSQACEKVLV